MLPMNGLPLRYIFGVSEGRGQYVKKVGPQAERLLGQQSMARLDEAAADGANFQPLVAIFHDVSFIVDERLLQINSGLELARWGG